MKQEEKMRRNFLHIQIMCMFISANISAFERKSQNRISTTWTQRSYSKTKTFFRVLLFEKLYVFLGDCFGAHITTCLVSLCSNVSFIFGCLNLILRTTSSFITTFIEIHYELRSFYDDSENKIPEIPTNWMFIRTSTHSERGLRLFVWWNWSDIVDLWNDVRRVSCV